MTTPTNRDLVLARLRELPTAHEALEHQGAHASASQAPGREEQPLSIRALSITQPWATLIAIGAKRRGLVPPIDRVLAKVVAGPGGCWVFTGSRQSRGHGLIRVGSRSDGTTHLEKAHRVTYEHFIGAIPKGLALDHVVCANPPCVNPWHLEPVTRGENTRRAVLSRIHCKNGHVLAEAGFVQLDSERRMCGLCYRKLRERQNKRRRERRAMGSKE